MTAPYTYPMTAKERFEAWPIAERAFLDMINIVNHEAELPFADKEAMVIAYKQAWPIFGHNCAMLQDALDRQNPAYQGMTEFRTCGERFYRTEGQWTDVTPTLLMRVDTYLYVPTQLTHILQYVYSKELSEGTIILDGVIVWGTALGQKVNSYHELPEKGINELLIKLGVLE